MDSLHKQMAALRNLSPAFIAIALIANTSMILAFRRDQAAHGAEFDVSMSQDGKISVLQDRTLQRTAAEHRPKFETERTNDTSAAKKAKSKALLNIIGRRGSSTDALENTMASTKFAIDQGAHGAEFDVSMSQDGNISVLHDRTIQRTAAAENRPSSKKTTTQVETFIVGHRGSSLDAPENTIASMKLAFEQGADGVEFDVSMSQDGKIFLLHDRTLKRTAAKDCPRALCLENKNITEAEYERKKEEYARNLEVDVSHLSYEEFIKHVERKKEEYARNLEVDVSHLSYEEFIKHVDVSSKLKPHWPPENVQHPPLMKDVMELLKFVPGGRFVLCDMKRQGAEVASAVVELIGKERESCEDPCPWQSPKLRFLSSDPWACDVIKQQLGDEFSVSLVWRSLHQYAARFMVSTYKGCEFDSIDFEAKPSVTTNWVVSAGAPAGHDIGVWVNSLNSREQDTAANVILYANMGVHHFTSNLPEDVKDLLKPLNIDWSSRGRDAA